jgi:hypothetical protein
MELMLVIKNIVLPFCVATLTFFNGAAQAEPFYSAKILQADYSAVPDIKLLIRIQDVESSSDEASGSSLATCMKASNSATQPGPNPCFRIQLDEGEGNVKVTSQTLLNDPQRASDPIYIELVYKSGATKNQYGYYDNKTVLLTVEDNNGLNNWDSDIPQSLPQVKIEKDRGIYQLVLADADALLNSAYRDKASRLSQDKRDVFREVQRAWMKNRDLECNSAIFGEYSESCLIRLTIDRARQIAVAPLAK